MSENTGLEPTTDSNEPLTIKQIARLAGVSIGTVDRVLHSRGRVSPENQAKIQAIVAAGGYQPNLHASQLSTGSARTKTLGVMLPRSEQDLGYWQLVQRGLSAAQDDLFGMPVRILVEHFDRRSPEACRASFERLLEARCDALALAPIHSGVLRPLVEALDPAFPLMFFDSDMDCHKSHGFVGQDPWLSGRLAGRLMTQSLPVGQGVALVRFAGDDEHLGLRADGFRSFLGETGRAVLELAQDLSTPVRDRQQQLADFRRAHPSVTGLFVPNATVSQYVVSTLFSVCIGYDVLPENQLALQENRIHFLISQRPEAMSREALRLLWRALMGRGEALTRVLMPIQIVVPENLQQTDN